MVRKLASLGFITRKKGVGRSIDFPVAIEGLPKWRGKMPSRTVQVWAPSPSISKPLTAPFATSNSVAEAISPVGGVSRALRTFR